MKQNYHGSGWFWRRFFGVTIIGMLSVWGMAYYLTPMFEWMNNIQRQLAAVVLASGLVFALFLVWVVAKITGSL